MLTPDRIEQLIISLAKWAEKLSKNARRTIKEATLTGVALYDDWVFRRCFWFELQDLT